MTFYRYYSITKRIIRTVLGLVLLVLAFALAFYVIHFDNQNESFETMQKSFVKSFVMVLGEFGKNSYSASYITLTKSCFYLEFEDLWSASETSKSQMSRMFTMLLLIGVILLGTIIMINLIVAIIITDIERLNRISKQQVLRNQVCCVCTFHCVHSV